MRLISGSLEVSLLKNCKKMIFSCLSNYTKKAQKYLESTPIIRPIYGGDNCSFRMNTEKWI